MMRRSTIFLTPLLLAAAGLLLHYGNYGLTLFVSIPILVGGTGAAIAQPKSAAGAAWAGVIACLVACVGLLIFAAEGLGCVVMVLPLLLPLGALGGVILYTLTHSKETVLSLALLPIASLGIDATATPPTYKVTTSIEINAPPERVWKNVVAFPDLAAPREWYFRAGLSYPTGTRIIGQGVGAKRFCDLSTGLAVETVTRWETARALEFDVTETPAPMEELSPYGHIEPKHLHGYFVSKHGRFVLTPLAGGRTRIDGTSWYQHGLYPAPFWRLWTDATVHKIHERVFEHIKALSENPSTRSPT